MPRADSTQKSGRYLFKRDGGGATGGLPNVHIVSDSSGCSVYKPSWNYTRTVFRIFPGRDPDNPSALDPFRRSDDVRDYGDWIRKYDAVVNLGDNGVTFITRDPRDSEFDRQNSPAWLLFRTVSNAVKRGQCPSTWNPLCFGKEGRGAPLSAPTDIYLLQGILLEHKSKAMTPPRGMNADDATVILMLSFSAGRALLEELDKRDEAGNYLWPDITSLDGGAYVTFYQEGTPLTAQQPTQTRVLGMADTAGPRQNRDVQRYGCTISATYNGMPASLAHMRDGILPKIKAWDEIIQHYTVEQQVRMICASGLPASAITASLQEAYGQFIPSTTFEKARTELQQTQQYVPVPQQMGGPMPQQPMLQQPMPQQPMPQPMPQHMPQPQLSSSGPPRYEQAPQQPLLGQQPGGLLGQTGPMLAPGVPPVVAPQQSHPEEHRASVPQTAEQQERQPGFDPQPTHADAVTAANTRLALEAARARMQRK